MTNAPFLDRKKRCPKEARGVLRGSPLSRSFALLFFRERKVARVGLKGRRPLCYNSVMKDKIHPEYHTVNVTCACGAEFEIGSTKKNIRVDICSKCHPLFTGKQKLMDTEGRVDKFKKKYAAKPVSLKKKKTRVSKKDKAKKGK